MPASAELDIHRRLLTAAVNAVRPTPWEQIVPANLRFAARAAYFLLDAGEREAESFIPDAETFLTESLERLLRKLTRVTERQQVERHGQVRGRVLWSATYKARYVQDYDPGLFVCRDVRQIGRAHV